MLMLAGRMKISRVIYATNAPRESNLSCLSSHSSMVLIPYAQATSLLALVASNMPFIIAKLMISGEQVRDLILQNSG
jgi:hypothetical protein